MKRALGRGRYPPGARMPSEAELVARFSVSRMTVNRALNELKEEGLVVRIQGLGTFAAQPHRVSSKLTIRDIHEEILARGHVHDARVHIAREERAKETVAARLSLARGAPVFHTLIVHCETGVPIQCEDRYVNPAAAPAYLERRLHAHTPTGYLLEVAPLWEAQYSIAATMPTAQEARLLGIAKATPASSSCAAPKTSRCRSPSHASRTREPATCSKVSSSHEFGNPLPARRSVQDPMTPHSIALGGVRPQPWRNGGGVTASCSPGQTPTTGPFA